MTTLAEWANEWNVPAAALADLRRRLGAVAAPTTETGASESRAQSEIRLEAATKGVRLWRNNVGVLKDETGRPVRYGLANDTPEMNAKIKSSDLIGWRPLVITPGLVGSTIAQFVAREVKRPGWRFTATDREAAQLRFLEMVLMNGGDACFATGTGTL